MLLSRVILCSFYLLFFSMYIHFYQIMYALTENDLLKTFFLAIALLVSGFTYDCMKTIFSYDVRRFKVFEYRNKALFINFSFAWAFIVLGHYVADLAINSNKLYVLSLLFYISCLFFVFRCNKNIDDLMEFI